MPKPFLGVGWSFPVDLQDSGAIRVAAYEESVRQAIWIILGTSKGERVMRPDFGCGIYDLVFEVNSASTAGKVACLDPATGGPLWTLALGDKNAHFSATPTVLVARTDGGDRRQLYIAGSIGTPNQPVVFCLEDFVKVE